MLGRSRKSAVGPEATDSGVEFPARIDLVALPPGEATIDLHIVQVRPWDGSDRQLLLLQEKIHNYVGYAVDGQLAAAYPGQATLPWRIVVGGDEAPDARTIEMLERLREPLARHGGVLVVKGRDD